VRGWRRAAEVFAENPDIVVFHLDDCDGLDRMPSAPDCRSNAAPCPGRV